MGASNSIKAILKDKKITMVEFADMYNPESKAENKVQTIRNMFHRDNMNFSTVEHMIELLDCEILFRDKKSGKIY